MNDALGLLEVAGLVAAVSASDAMVKAANVQLIGIEKAKGHAWMTVKITGDVGAVTSAIESGAAIAEQLHSLVTQKVIPRPTNGLMDCFKDDYKVRASSKKPEKPNINKKHSEEIQETSETVLERVPLDEKAVEVLGEIVSKIVDPKQVEPKIGEHKQGAPKNGDTEAPKKGNLKRSPKKK